MPRGMSFWLTQRQMREEIKDVTRRLGWNFLKPGDIVNAMEKCQGLKKGEKQVLIYPIRIRSIRKEPLFTITRDEVVREGFPWMTPIEFVEMFCRANKCSPTEGVNRIAFKRHRSHGMGSISDIGEEFRATAGSRALHLEKEMEKHSGPDWWQEPYDDIDICWYIAEHFPMMVSGNVLPAYARVRDMGALGNLQGAL